ncbi:discoidin domain-containing protein [Paenibacillus sp. SYP-B4298]|uniref:discoidin domain-containing protein n=1 Tax=Paenibacillus sp. SYP-B4298 TaxID=2996034 RepID=UPI0022DE5192|nr:discoidin domain-containing protein [Paenibacillus sp. SYP-B4298]
MGTNGENENSIRKILILIRDKCYSLNSLELSSGNLIPVMKSDKNENGTASASSVQTSEYPAWKVFDGLTTTDWRSAIREVSYSWLRYDFNEPVKVNRYVLRGYKQNEQSPSDWTLQGSNDGANWTILDSRTDVNDWSVEPNKQYDITYTTEYHIYRIVFTKVNNNTLYYIIKNFELYWFSRVNYIAEMESITEQNFIKYGMNKGSILDMKVSMNNKILINTSSSRLGSGKLFKQVIDSSRMPIKKITIQ